MEYLNNDNNNNKELNENLNDKETEKIQKNHLRIKSK